MTQLDTERQFVESLVDIFSVDLIGVEVSRRFGEDLELDRERVVVQFRVNDSPYPLHKLESLLEKTEGWDLDDLRTYNNVKTMQVEKFLGVDRDD